MFVELIMESEEKKDRRTKKDSTISQERRKEQRRKDNKVSENTPIRRNEDWDTIDKEFK